MHVEEANMGGMGKGKQKETLTTESKSGEPGAVGLVRHTVKSTYYYMEGKPKPRLEGTHPRSPVVEEFDGLKCRALLQTTKCLLS